MNLYQPVCESIMACTCNMKFKMGRDATKPIFKISDKLRFKPACSATETSWKVETSLAASLDMILSKKRITKMLIRLRGCAGWSTPLLVANLQRQVFSQRGPNMTIVTITGLSALMQTWSFKGRYVW